MKEDKKLYRSKNDRIIAGVCGGLGKYFEIDPLIFRMLFVLFVLFGGSGILVYILFWILVPEEGETRSKEFSQNIKEGANKMAEEVKDPKNQGKNYTGGVILIVLGILFLISNFVPQLDFGKLWPLILVAIGIVIIYNSTKK